MFSPSSVLRGLKPSLLLPKMSPTFQFFPPDEDLTEPFPRFRHLLQAMQRAISRERGTDTAAAINTEELTSAGMREEVTP